MNARIFCSLIGVLLFFSFLITCVPTASAKAHEPVVTKIEISAPPQAVFEALRKMRDCAEFNRHQRSFDGKVAIIDEHMKSVVIYGTVDNVWQETEQPFTRIDYKLVKSNHFKEGFGSWILKPTPDGKSTSLEHDSYVDAALPIPFAGTLTKNESTKSSNVRLEWLKKTAEQIAKEGAGK
jgi:uncharacterized protein YndB with AHSA1/START domain